MDGSRDERHNGLEPSEELRAVMRRLYQAMNDHDFDTIGNLISDEPSVLSIGTDPEEWWCGHPAITAVWRTQFEEFEFLFRSEALEAWVQGPVGWVADRPTLVVGTEEISARITVVFHLVRGQWRFIQMHLSTGTANEQLLGTTLTTSLETLVSYAETVRPDMAEAAAPDGTVSVVFTDIEGSTEMTERMGDHGWMELLRWHDAIVRENAGRFDGFVVKSQGDGFMLAFSSAARALDFALAVQTRTAAGYGDQPVRIRVGINTGEIIRERDDFYGRAVIKAARVAAQAQGGEVLVSDLVAGLVAGVDRFRFGPERVAELKGLAGRHTLYPLLQPA
ncbi:MAG TPA: nuclear transport factor 2 family protein [Acidimicrobiales bacterium]|jgi:class 3 adenylate cyclase